MAWVSQTPQRACSQYALIPISGALMPSAIKTSPSRPSQGCHIRAGDPAVDQELRRGDKRRVVAGEECYRCGYLLRLGEPAKRDVHQPAGGALRVLGVQLTQQRRIHRARAQRVDPDALPGELHAELA